MRRHLLLKFLIILAGSVYGQQTKSALFIGNSYTYYNDMPTMVASMATSVGNTLTQDDVTVGGRSIKIHSQESSTYDAINTRQWDYVILQEQSKRLAYDDDYIASECTPYFTKLSDSIKDNGSIPMMYRTWGRKNGDADDCVTYEGMDDKLETNYTIQAQNNQGWVSPAGKVWRYLRNNGTSIELYDPDESHPSLEGSYAVALTFYVMIFQEDPTLVTYHSTLSDDDVNEIKQAVKTVVYDNLDDYDHTDATSITEGNYTKVKNEIARYNILGKPVSADSKGLVIIKYDDGSSEKLYLH